MKCRIFSLFIIIFLVNSNQSLSQYYLRGIVKDEKGNAVGDIKFTLKSTNQVPYTNGLEGTFGLNISYVTDSMTVFAPGFETVTVFVSSKVYNTIFLKSNPNDNTPNKKGLASKTDDYEYDATDLIEKHGESYSGLIENAFIKCAKNPETSFGLNIDRAAYSNIRRIINNQMVVPEDAVRIEEMLNYFDFKERENNTDKFQCKTFLTTCPWNKNNHLLFINTDAPKIKLDSVPASNLVFLIDVSGSMERPNRLPLLQAAFKLLVDNLRPKDRVAIVTYGGGVEVELASTSGSNKLLIKNVIDSLYANGDTPGADAIKIAYAQAKKSFIYGGNNRVILATDGDFNVGQSTDKELEDIVAAQKNTGIYLTCIGVGMGNYKDSKLEGLAKKGNGNFAYLDDIQEAEKVFLQEFTKTIYAVAKDAYVKINFNKEVVNEYRLIGYDNKKDIVQEPNSVIGGGEVGSGHSSMAVFEINLNRNYNFNQQIADILIEYKKITKDEKVSLKNSATFTSIINIDSANVQLKLATAICMYGSILKKSKYCKGFDFDDINTLLESSVSKSNTLQQEFLGLLKKSEEIYKINKPKKKKKKK